MAKTNLFIGTLFGAFIGTHTSTTIGIVGSVSAASSFEIAALEHEDNANVHPSKSHQISLITYIDCQQPRTEHLTVWNLDRDVNHDRILRDTQPAALSF